MPTGLNKLAQRPPDYRLDMQHPLWQGLLLGCFGRFPGSTKVFDSGPFNNQCSIVNAATVSSRWRNSPLLQRLGFYANASGNGYISCGQPANINQITSITMAAWVRPYNVTTAATLLSCQSGTQGWSLNINQNASGQSAGALSMWAHSGSWAAAAYAAGLVSGTHYHIAATLSASQTVLYLNGAAVATASHGVIDVGNNLVCIGSNAGSSTEDAEFYDVCFFSGVRPWAIQQLASRDPMYGGAIMPLSRSWTQAGAAGATFLPYPLLFSGTHV